MASLISLLTAYLLGGFTLLPLLAIGLLIHFLLTAPKKSREAGELRRSESFDADERADLAEKLKQPTHEPDVAAGYFAVCREYVPGGVNGKPPERTTPAGETIAAESPSVYQTIARSIWDRRKTQVPSIESSSGKPLKKARNVFFVVLRHGHLVLFDNSDQLEVRHVIALAHYDLDVYAGGESIPEGELWIKRNCIRLRKKVVGKDTNASTAAPFYLFSDNCSEKEDFYHAILNNQSAETDSEAQKPIVQGFETEDMIKLIRQLHLSEEHAQNKWMNALLGRLFLGLYKTADLESFIRTKVMKKMSRVSKPAFISSLNLESIDMGSSAPLFTNVKLRDMTVDGALTLEADVKYTGNFKLVTSAVARIELGSRFKAREVTLVLAGTFKRLEGHMLLKCKPPPSNRLWFAFETMPKVDIHLEPIVSSRQITYSVILRTLESKIREVMSDTLVLPNWDDIPFTRTEDKPFRGGIFKDRSASDRSASAEAAVAETFENNMASHASSGNSTPIDIPKGKGGPAVLPNDSPTIVGAPGPTTPSMISIGETDGASAVEISIKSSEAEKPKALRRNSFATATPPVISKGPAQIDSTKHRSLRNKKQDAASAMRVLSQRSPETSPVGSPQGGSYLDAKFSSMRNKSYSMSGTATPTSEVEIPGDGQIAESGDAKPTFSRKSSRHKSLNEIENFETSNTAVPTIINASASDTKSNRSSAYTRRSSAGVATNTSSHPSTPIDKKQTLNQSLKSATAAAGNWGWSMLSKQMDGNKSGRNVDSSETIKARSGEPIGRGQPLPPPGTPLPKPEKANTWTTGAFSSLKRKPVPPVSASAMAAASAAAAGVGGTRSSNHSPVPSKDHSRRSSRNGRSFSAMPTEHVMVGGGSAEVPGGDEVLTIGTPVDDSPQGVAKKAIESDEVINRRRLSRDVDHDQGLEDGRDEDEQREVDAWDPAPSPPGSEKGEMTPYRVRIARSRGRSGDDTPAEWTNGNHHDDTDRGFLAEQLTEKLEQV